MAATGGPDPERDEEILEAFVVENPRPRAGDVERWSRLYPHLRDRILALAMDHHRFAADDPGGPTQEEDEASWRRHQAGVRRIVAQAARSPRLADMAGAEGTDLAAVADAIDMDRRILSGLDAGRIMPPVSQRLVVALAAALKRSNEQVAEALDSSFASPRVAFAKADGAPRVARSRYADAVAASDMSAERKTFWTGED